MRRIRVSRTTREDWDVFALVDDSDETCFVEQLLGTIKRERGHYVVAVADWAQPGQPLLTIVVGFQFGDILTAAHFIEERS